MFSLTVFPGKISLGAVTVFADTGLGVQLGIHGPIIQTDKENDTWVLQKK